jgi:hypothetical protein
MGGRQMAMPMVRPFRNSECGTDEVVGDGGISASDASTGEGCGTHNEPHPATIHSRQAVGYNEGRNVALQAHILHTNPTRDLSMQLTAAEAARRQTPKDEGEQQQQQQQSCFSCAQLCEASSEDELLAQLLKVATKEDTEPESAWLVFGFNSAAVEASRPALRALYAEPSLDH